MEKNGSRLLDKKKGFVLTETLAITIFLVTVFTFVYVAIIPLIGKYRDMTGRENDIDIVYKLYHIRKMIRDDENQSNVTNSSVKSLKCDNMSNVDYCNNLMKSLNLEDYTLLYIKNVKENKNSSVIKSNDIKQYISNMEDEVSMVILLDNKTHTIAHLRYANDNIMGSFPNVIKNEKEKIIEVYFKKEKLSVIKEKYNASSIKANVTKNGQGNVFAWLEPSKEDPDKYVMYVESSGTTFFDTGASLFSGFENLKKIDFDNIDTSLVKNMSSMFSDCENLESIDLSKFDTSNVTTFSYMFHDCKKITELDISRFDTIKATNMAEMFSGCEKIEHLDFSNFDTRNVINMNLMFANCVNIIEIDLGSFNTEKLKWMSSMFSRCENVKRINVASFDTKNITNFSGLFFNCVNLVDLDVSHFNTSNATTMSSMFAQCYNIEKLDVSNFDTSNVISFNSMFRFCTKLQEADVSNFKTSNATNMAGMFDMAHKLTVLDVSGFDTKNVTSMSGMFRWIDNLTSLDLSSFDTSNVTDMSEMFYDTRYLVDLDLSTFDTSKVTNMNYMFAYNKSEILDISNFDTRNVTNMHAMFYDMDKLKTLITGPYFSTAKVENFGMMFESCSNLIFDFKLLDTSSAVYMYRMLGGLKIDIADLTSFDTSKVIDMMGMFSNIKSKELHLESFDFSKVSYHGGNDYYNSSVNFKMFFGISTSTKIYVKDEASKTFIEARLQEAGRSNEVIIV